MDNQENDEIKEAVNIIETTAEGMVIANDKDLQNATLFIKDVKDRYKVIENFYEPMVTSAKNNYDIIKAERDKYLKPLKQVEDEIKDMMNDYNNKTGRKSFIPGMSTRSVITVKVLDIEQVPKTLNLIPLLELSKMGKDYLIKQYKLAKSLGQEFHIDGIEIKEELTTVVR